jgi:hypothetical protein
LDVRNWVLALSERKVMDGERYLCASRNHSAEIKSKSTRRYSVFILLGKNSMNVKRAESIQNRSRETVSNMAYEL